MKHLSKKITLSVGLILSPIVSQAAVLALYNFNDSVVNTNSADFANKAGAANITVSDLTNGSGLPFSATISGGYVLNGNNTASDGIWLFSGTNNSQPYEGFSLAIPAGATVASFDDAVAAGDYFSFTVTPQPGYSIALDSLSFMHSGNNAGNYPNQIAVRIGGTQIGSSITVTRVASSAYTSAVLDLTSANYSNDAAFTVEIVVFGSAGGGTLQATRHLQLDDIALNGTVIPEPSTYAALFGLAALWMTFLRRRRD